MNRSITLLEVLSEVLSRIEEAKKYIRHAYKNGKKIKRTVRAFRTKKRKGMRRIRDKKTGREKYIRDKNWRKRVRKSKTANSIRKRLKNTKRTMRSQSMRARTARGKNRFISRY